MSMLKSFSDFALTKSEMKEVHGGYWSLSCTCANGNRWTGGGETMEDFLFLDNHYCGGGATKCSGTGNLN
jgi:hypothetical protein